MKNAAMHARKRMEDACAFAIERQFGKAISVVVNVKALKSLKQLKVYCQILKIPLPLFLEREV